MKEFEDYLIAADLDGTLYKTQHNIPKENIDAINEFVKKGGKFTIATGRGIEAARFVSKEIQLSCPAIVSNGNTLYDYDSDKLIYTQYYPDSVKCCVKEFYSLFPSLGIEVYCDKDIYVLRENEVIKHHLNYENVEYKIADIDDIWNLDWSKLLMADEVDALQPVKQYAAKYQKNGFEFVSTSEKYFEIILSGVNKGTALIKLAEFLDIPHNHVYAIGNYYNDKEMIERAGMGCVVNDTPTELKGIADYVTKSDCENGALAEFIQFVMD
ncbi:MAG: Cof-type HAD-IIB family hydrolase [Clostridia bacterium]|nr:Cof-type HAD-IIB family hydrolase [Clostridia bacterium]